MLLVFFVDSEETARDGARKLMRPDVIAVGLILGICRAASVWAQEFDQGPVFTFVEENDLVVDTDRHYTQGIKLSYLEADGQLPRWLARFSRKLPSLGFSNAVERIGFAIGQNIFTPADITARELLANDRPYAGWLYTGLILQRRGFSDTGHLTLEHFQLDLGVIGPESLAREAQTWVHEIRGINTPKGWDHQLKTEPGIALKYLRIWRISPDNEQRVFDLMPLMGSSLGNVETSVRAGASLRLGWNLPDDFGAQTISSLMTTEGGWSPNRTQSRWGFYVFSGVEGSIVLYTAFLNGNLYRDSHRIDGEPFVGEWKSGAVAVLGRVETGFTYVFRTREFIGQTEDNGYGSVFIKVKW